MQQHPFKAGQRWVSDGERDLGLGEVLEATNRTVLLAFPATGIQRTYSVNQAPLTRIIFRPEDQIQNDEGDSLVVKSVVEDDGFLVYECLDSGGETVAVAESRINSAMQFNRPQDRLFTGSLDPDKWFLLRKQTLAIKSALQQSPVQGLIGGRVELIPHQLYIAAEVGSRHAPRVLLADEVGLGKTIEAGLILHRQLESGQVSRVLIVLPDALVHQWLVEMLRRFNLKFSVFDEQRCLETSDENPFESSQLIIASLSFFMGNPLRRQQVGEAGWDMLIVDEAHHLQWSEQSVSDEYAFVEQLAMQTPGLLLLTATPEQLGVSSHFARLRLLDPARFHDLSAFIEEEKNYEPVAKAASALIEGKSLNVEQSHWMINALPEFKAIIKTLGSKKPAAGSTSHLIQAVLDRHGTGRVLFRNTRDVISGFQERRLQLDFLELAAEYSEFRWGEAGLRPETEWRNSGIAPVWTKFDPRVDWLKQLIQTHHGKKILVICANPDTAIDLEQELRVRHALRSAVFHEGMNMVARDRAAAWFADPDENAQCLICSEIGSEGRNFQFSHHLVLLDLPLNPDLLEQRIGRLDRIGQKHVIHIHLPAFADSSQEKLALWYHKGLNAFEKTCPTGSTIYGQIKAELISTLKSDSDPTQLIRKTRALDKKLRQRLQAGRDKLLELGSCRPKVANEVIKGIQVHEKPDDLVSYLEKVCDCYNVHLRDHSINSYRIRPGDHMRTSHFPGLTEEGFVYTPDRELAVSREDLQFMTWEHPLVSGAIDLILTDETGNAAFTIVDLDQLPTGALLVETSHVLDTIAPPEMALHRFMPLTSIRIVTDPDGRDFSAILDDNDLVTISDPIPKELIKSFINVNQNRIKAAISSSDKIAKGQADVVIRNALGKMLSSLDYEYRRLADLRQRNAFIREDELEFIAKQKTELQARIESAQTRIDAVRVIVVR